MSSDRPDYVITIEYGTGEIVGWSEHHYLNLPVYNREEATIEGSVRKDL